MSFREEPHNHRLVKVGGDGCFLRFQPDGKPVVLDGKQIIGAVVPGPIIIYLTDYEVDPELGMKRTGHASAVRSLPSTRLLQILANVPGSLG